MKPVSEILVKRGSRNHTQLHFLDFSTQSIDNFRRNVLLDFETSEWKQNGGYWTSQMQDRVNSLELKLFLMKMYR